MLSATSAHMTDILILIRRKGQQFYSLRKFQGRIALAGIQSGALGLAADTTNPHWWVSTTDIDVYEINRKYVSHTFKVKRHHFHLALRGCNFIHIFLFVITHNTRALPELT